MKEQTVRLGPREQRHDLVIKAGESALGGAVVAVAFSRDGRWLATGSKDKTARIAYNRSVKSKWRFVCPWANFIPNA